MAQVYIKKVERDTMRVVGYLSPGRTRWLPYNSKHRLGKFSEAQAEKFCLDRSEDDQYYYFRQLI